LAGSGRLAQQYALGVRKGADALRARLDAALATLSTDGTLAQIARRELGLETNQLTPPGELPDLPGDETGASSSSQGCLDGLAWLEDLSLPDLGMTAPAVMARDKRSARPGACSTQAPARGTAAISSPLPTAAQPEPVWAVSQ